MLTFDRSYLMSEPLNFANDPSNVDSTPRKKTMSPAAIAANRANARKSTGPRTRNGKITERQHP